MTTYIEDNCSIQLGERSYAFGGSYMCKDRNGMLRGLLYIHHRADGRTELGDWHGSFKLQTLKGTPFLSNFGDKRTYLYFWYQHLPMIGIWYMSTDVVRVRQLKHIPACMKRL